MVKDKIRFCPKCLKKMKYRGSKIWLCLSCKIAYHYYHEVLYELDENGKPIINMFGKLKIIGLKEKVKHWHTTR